MDLNLIYSGYSTKQLLLLLAEKGSGQKSPEAIATIKEILATRSLTEEEHAAVYGKPVVQAAAPVAVVAVPAFTPNTPSYGQRQYQRPEDEVTAPYTNSETVTLFRWLVVLIVGIPTLFQVINMMTLYQAANTEENVDWLKLSFTFIGNFIFIGAAVTGMIFFVRQRALGWYFLSAICTFKALNLLFTVLLLIVQGYAEASKLLWVMLLFTLGATILLLLPPITRAFHVKRLAGGLTVGIAAFVAVLIAVVQVIGYLAHS